MIELQDSSNITEHESTVSMFFSPSEASREELFEHLYDMKKLIRWLSLYPIIWVTSKDKYWDKGSEMIFHNAVPPFYHPIKCTELVMNEYFCAEYGGFLKGKEKIELVPKDNGFLFVQTISVAGRTKFGHNYYVPGSKHIHEPYMMYRLSRLKKFIKDSR